MADGEQAARQEVHQEKKTGDHPSQPEARVEKKKAKKISRMTLAEIDQKLKAAQESMGGFQSDFARHLLARKKELTSPSSKS